MQDRPGLCNNAGPSRFVQQCRTVPVSHGARRDAYVASFSPRSCRTLRVALEEAGEHATLGAPRNVSSQPTDMISIAYNRIASNDIRCRRQSAREGDTP
jgi:hypothetical protein